MFEDVRMAALHIAIDLNRGKDGTFNHVDVVLADAEKIFKFLSAGTVNTRVPGDSGFTTGS